MNVTTREELVAAGVDMRRMRCGGGWDATRWAAIVDDVKKVEFYANGRGTREGSNAPVSNRGWTVSLWAVAPDGSKWVEVDWWAFGPDEKAEALAKVSELLPSAVHSERAVR